MSEREQVFYQRIIQQLREGCEQKDKEIKTATDKITFLQQQIQYYQQKQLKLPFSLLSLQSDHQAIAINIATDRSNQRENKITEELDCRISQLRLLQQRTAVQSSELLELTKAKETMEQLLTQSQVRNRELEKVLGSQSYEIRRLKMTLTRSEQQCKDHEKRIQELRKAKEEVAKQKLDLLQQYMQASAEKDKLKEDNQQLLKQLANHYRRSQTSMREESQELDAQHVKELNLLLNNLQSELAQRNESLIRSATHDPEQSVGETAYKHTLRQLRKEISSKTQLTRKVATRLQEAQAVIKRFQQLSLANRGLEKKYDEQILQFQDQQKQLQLLIQQNANLQQQLSKKNNALQRHHQQFVMLLEQNQCYHRFMHSEYGTNYQIVIKQEREKLLERLAKREKYNQWATIKELVDMNCKLLGKIP